MLLAESVETRVEINSCSCKLPFVKKALSLLVRFTKMSSAFGRGRSTNYIA